jgi:glucosamine 6-phosphate synthetase-like amidotransferase/phosphosugar isomerase protein
MNENACQGLRFCVTRASKSAQLGRQLAPCLTPVTAIVPLQKLAASIAKRRGRNPDAPEGLTKITRTH